MIQPGAEQFYLGEFSSPKQGTFYHYNDFWYLEPSSREWTRLEVKGTGPPARSGHRMTYFKVILRPIGFPHAGVVHAKELSRTIS